jgi:hypothetical protein
MWPSSWQLKQRMGPLLSKLRGGALPGASPKKLAWLTCRHMVGTTERLLHCRRATRGEAALKARIILKGGGVGEEVGRLFFVGGR